MACRVFSSSTGIPLFLEKPVATNMEDLWRLKRAYELAGSDTKVIVSFPLRMTPIVELVKEIIDSGKIGTVEHVQAVNNVPYGIAYFQGWYRDENEAGGLFLQKSTHDFDYINYLLGGRPIEVCAMSSKQVFKGDKPERLKCSDCEERETCLESDLNSPRKWIKHCCFAVDTGNEDSGSALIRYESGMHVSYSQNFFCRKETFARGARLFGYKGTLEFDFYTNIVKVVMHHTPEVETHEVKPEGHHFGGDPILAQNLLGMMSGKEKSLSTLESGLLSALMCIKARESAQTRTFQEITWG
jgi:predicted dehydrogenase